MNVFFFKSEIFRYKRETSMKIECKLFEIYPCIVTFYQYRGYNAGWIKLCSKKNNDTCIHVYLIDSMK